MRGTPPTGCCTLNYALKNVEMFSHLFRCVPNKESLHRDSRWRPTVTYRLLLFVLEQQIRRTIIIYLNKTKRPKTLRFP